MADIPATIARWRLRFDTALESCLELVSGAPEPLKSAMRYSALAGGKRMRPLLVYGAGEALNVPLEALDAPAVAIEIIHAYSLIHDDLPAMDDDDIRRGQPTCHRAFDEATAILAGDALQALAFQILATDPELSRLPKGQTKIMRDLSIACGATGMAGGQAIDLAAVGENLTQAGLEHMHQLKTGALIRLASTAPGVVHDADQKWIDRLDIYGHCIGLAFQIHDDILDVTGSVETLGKPTQKDAHLQKPTFPGTLGLEQSRQRARELRDLGLAEIRHFPGNHDALDWLAAYAIARDS